MYDPTAELYLARDARPDELARVEIADLTPFQRALLVIDGTVTTFLEAWALEPIQVRRLWQTLGALADDDPWLDASRATPVLDRAVTLIGGQSGSFFAFAESRILPDRLPADMRQALDDGSMGLGQILLATRIDSRREGLWFGRERRTNLPDAVSRLSDGDFLTRTYRVSAAGRPWMLITERFPWRPVVRTG